MNSSLNRRIEPPFVAVLQEGQPADIEARKSWPWWKLRKWTLHVINRMFSRFGDAKNSRHAGENSKMFRDLFPPNREAKI